MSFNQSTAITEVPKSVSLLDEFHKSFDFYAVSGIFPPLSSKNSGILVGFKSEKKDEDLTSDKSSASLVPKIFKAIDRETGEECVCKIVTGESFLLEEEVVRAAVSEKNGFLATDRLFVFRIALYGNLNELFNKYGLYPLDISTSARITMSLAGGLDFLHQRGISHGFINPEHCLLDDLGNIRLCGLSNLFKGHRAETYRWIDSEDRTIYFAPEVCFPEQSVDPFAVDMFACGVVIHRCLLGVFPRSSSPSFSSLRELIRKTKPCARHCCSVSSATQNGKLLELKEPLMMLRNLLTAIPNLRPGSRAICSSNWIKKAMKSRTCIPPSVFWK